MKALRKQAGLTQVQLASQTKVREQAVRAWENGKAIPGLDKAVLLSIALNVSLVRLAAEFGLTVDGIPDEEEEGVMT